MDHDRILETLNRHEVAHILIGGVNFLLRHAPVLTFDIDLWIDDMPENVERCERALVDLEASWGPSEAQWRPVAELGPGWLQRQAVFCLISPYGAIDIFRSVKGLESWSECRRRAESGRTATGMPFLGLSDRDMLQCQLALPEELRNQDRVRALERALEAGGDEH